MSKENISKIKREPNIWENIFANDTSDKVLISKIYNELKCQKDKKSNQKIGKRPEQTLVQGGHTEGPETYERMLSITSHQRDAN